MNRVVVDSSVVIKWFVEEEYSLQALSLYRAFSFGDIDLIAPDLIYPEIGNIVWKKHRFQGLGEKEALSIFESFHKIPLRIFSCQSLFAKVTPLALISPISFYDLVYVGLGLEQGCAVVTADEKMVQNLKKNFSHLVHVVNWKLTK